MSKAVPPEGSSNARLILIGEAPGSFEERLLRPFVGPSGQLLDRLLGSVGLSRSECYLTNVVKERPKNNNISILLDLTGKIPKETPEYRTYRAALLEELGDCSATTIVALGRTALYTLTGHKEISKWRGSVLECQELKKKVIGTFHPSSALREPLEQNIISTDLRKALRESATKDITRPVRTYHLNPSEIEAMAFLQSCNQVSEVGFDIEVNMTSHELICFAVAKSSSEIMCIPLMASCRDNYPPEVETALLLELGKLLANPQVKKVGQNLIFDCSFMFSKYGFITKNIWDTMIAQAICFPDFQKDLGFLASLYTEEPYYKDDGKQWKNPNNDTNFWLYNAKDAAVCLDIKPKLEIELGRQDNLKIYEQQLALIDPLIFMQHHGIQVDRSEIEIELKNRHEAIAVAEKRLQELTGGVFNSNSPKQLANYFYITKGEKPYVNRATGNVTTDSDALKRLSRKGYEEARLILDIRKNTKMCSTYLEMDFDVDNRIRCSFNPVGTKSGRLSSSKTIFGTGGNMQNLPSSFKTFMKADAGFVVYNVDLSQAENRTVAYIAPDSSMIDAFEKGVDIHKQTASLIFKKPIEDISDEIGSTTIGGGQLSERGVGKKANHGLDYDLSYKRFALLNEITEKEAKFIVECYHEVYPGVRRYHSWVQQKLGKDKTLVSCSGRVRKFLAPWGDDLFREAYSFIPQSTVADLLNLNGLLYLYQSAFNDKHLYILNQVHDSLVFEVSLSLPWIEHAKLLVALKRSLEMPLSFNGYTFTIPADIAFGLDLSAKVSITDKQHKLPDTVDLVALRLETLYKEKLQSAPLQ